MSQTNIRCTHIDHKNQTATPITDQQKSLIQSLDSMIWMDAISDQERNANNRSEVLFTCICPKCSGGSKTKNKINKSNTDKTAPANHTAAVLLNQDGEGYILNCLACGHRSTVQNHLKEKNALAAEIYKIARFNINCAGHTWNCETPDFWKTLSLNDFEQRRQKYKEIADEKKRLNKENYEKRMKEKGC